MTKKDYSSLYLEKQLCFPLYAASRLTTKIYEPLLNALDITYPQYLVLMVLWQEEQLTVNEIGSRLFLESNTLTPLLKRLEQKGLVTRQRAAEDERKVLISLTKEGNALKRRAVNIPEQLVANLSNDSITEKEMLQFQTTLKKLVGLLSESMKK